MQSIIFVLIVLGLTLGLACFFLGVIYGRNTAYETVKTFQTADTHVDIASAEYSKSEEFS
jgi:hypothetical protein